MNVSVDSPLPVAEQLGMGRVAEVDQYALQGGSVVQGGFTHTTYDPITGQPASIATVAGTVNYAYDPAAMHRWKLFGLHGQRPWFKCVTKLRAYAKVVRDIFEPHFLA